MSVLINCLLVLKNVDVDDVAGLGSSFDQDSETCISSDITSPRSISQLEFPMPERLLPVGPPRDFSGLVEHVRQALGVHEIEGINVYRASMLSNFGTNVEISFHCLHRI